MFRVIVLYGDDSRKRWESHRYDNKHDAEFHGYKKVKSLDSFIKIREKKEETVEVSQNGKICTKGSNRCRCRFHDTVFTGLTSYTFSNRTLELSPIKLYIEDMDTIEKYLKIERG